MGPLLCGAPHRHVRELDGVDLSPGMVAKAVARGCYSRLEVADVVAFLDAATSTGAAYDVCVAADVFVYLGELGPVLRAAARVARRSGAWLAFSTEAAPADGHDNASCGEPGYRLMPTGRYTHSQRYLESVQAAAGWTPVAVRASIIRYNAGQPVHGYLCVARRTE
jgi:predicted TPR repeat methyltransferase